MEIDHRIQAVLSALMGRQEELKRLSSDSQYR